LEPWAGGGSDGREVVPAAGGGSGGETGKAWPGSIGAGVGSANGGASHHQIAAPTIRVIRIRSKMSVRLFIEE